MARRGIKEFKASEALELILADRDQNELVCPSCGDSQIERTPKRRIASGQATAYRHVKLRCTKCDRSAVYVPQALAPTT